LVLPGIELVQQARAALRGKASPAAVARALATRGALLGATAGFGALPQMLAWKSIYGAYLLPCPPHGCDFLRLDHPFLLETFFSSRHGLLSWTPVFWAGYLGFLPLLRTRRALALVLAVPLVLMTYVN